MKSKVETSSAAMNSDVEPPQKKKQRMNPPFPSFLSLPYDIVVNCLARISRSYYPKLSLVCKTFHSFVLSEELNVARFHLKSMEGFFHVCLHLPDHPSPSWYSLWIKPNQTLTNDIAKKKKKKKSKGNTLLVPSPSSYYPTGLIMFTIRVGSELYGLKQDNDPCPVLWIFNEKSGLWCEVSRMTVARASPVARVYHEKIYVIGGCDESMNWAEVFDIKTQTWELLPNPSPELRASSIEKVGVTQGNLYVRTSEKENYVYDPKNAKWDVARVSLRCGINNLLYGCYEERLWWYGRKQGEWRMVRGLDELNSIYHCCLIEIAEYNGKLLILWDEFVHRSSRKEKEIWCAVIALESRNNGDEVWGKLEWASVVLRVPSSYVFVRSLVSSV